MSDEVIRSLLSLDGRFLSVLGLLNGDCEGNKTEIVNVIQDRLPHVVVVSMSSTNMSTLNDWCIANCTGLWFTPLWWSIYKTWPSDCEYWFESQSDAAFFTLVWVS